jgi:hypothetical protein
MSFSLLTARHSIEIIFYKNLCLFVPGAPLLQLAGFFILLIGPVYFYGKAGDPGICRING